jgi:hypothetical protein
MVAREAQEGKQKTEKEGSGPGAECGAQEEDRLALANGLHEACGSFDLERVFPQERTQLRPAFFAA